MTDKAKGAAAEVLPEVEELRRRLEESEQVIHAIRTGAVDALVVSAPEGEKIYTLHGAEHPYRVLVEGMQEGAVTLSNDGTIVYCNRRLSQLLQIPHEKIIGSSLLSYVLPGDRPLLAASLEKCVQHAEPLEISLLTAVGELPALVSCCVLDYSGSATVSVIVRDISARKSAERTILRLNRLYAVLAATTSAIVHSSDEIGIFREFCRVATEAGGFALAWVGLVEQDSKAVSVAAASGETAYLEGMHLVADAEAEGMGAIVWALEKGTHYICNNFVNDPLARPWHARAHAHGLHALATIAIRRQKQVVGVFALYAPERDFFDAQQMELLLQVGAEVSFALDNLHHAVLRRETELALQKETEERLRAVEELRRNEQMLTVQSRQAAMGEMIGNIAHQWRQPLNNLGMLVQQIPLYNSLGEVTQEFLESNAKKAMELIRHMSRTIDDFRNFFNPHKEKVVFSLKEEVGTTLSLIEGSFNAHNISLSVEVRGEPMVHGYPNEFSQVLMSVLTNARDALTERKVPLPQTVIGIAAEDGKAIVTVADNAGGIAEAIIGKVFDPYFTTKGPQAGSGVGLFMAKTIVEKNMGGILSVRNTATGAEFRIEFARWI